MIMELQRRQVLERASLSDDSGVIDSKFKFNHEGNSSGKKKTAVSFKIANENIISNDDSRRTMLLLSGTTSYLLLQFLKLSIKDRFQAVKRLRLCINCLRDDHFVTDCKSSSCR